MEVALLVLMWVVWRERNRKALEGINDFVHVTISSLFFVNLRDSLLLVIAVGASLRFQLV